MLPISAGNSPDKRQLLRLFNDLSDADKQTVLAFIEFLAQRNQTAASGGAAVDVQESPVPRDIPRPEKESVVAAMRRLSATYFMLNKDELLHKASGLMSEHILQGKAANIAIDELEALFADTYTQQLEQQNSKTQPLDDTI